MQVRKYLYAEGREPIVVPEDEEREGWHDSPLPFVKTTDFGVEPDDQAGVQAVGESIYGVRDYLNGMLNLELMNMKELRAFAKEHFSKAPKSTSKKKLIRKIKAIQYGDSSRHH